MQVRINTYRNHDIVMWAQLVRADWMGVVSRSCFSAASVDNIATAMMH